MTIEKTSRNTPDRMDLPFVGLATFARQPACLDWDRLDVAVLGVPIDIASSYRVGTRFGQSYVLPTLQFLQRDPRLRLAGVNLASSSNSKFRR
jgi:hypothetical protein